MLVVNLTTVKIPLCNMIESNGDGTYSLELLIESDPNLVAESVLILGANAIKGRAITIDFGRQILSFTSPQAPAP